MLCKRLSRLRTSSALSHRLFSSSSASIYPFRNLRVFPFQLSRYDAERYIAPYASLICRQEMLKSVMSRFFPSLGLQPIKPSRLTPIYFPGWIIDVEVKAKVMVNGDDHETFVHVSNTYVPGSDYKVISSAAIVPVVPHARQTVPFSEDVLQHDDMDVVCIPYNISPFSIVDVVHELSYSEATINQHLRYIPSSVNPTLFAAYPVLIPLYLAQYEYENELGKGLHTFFVEAFGKEGNVWSEPFSDHLSMERDVIDQARQWIGFKQKNNVVMNCGYPKKFTGITGVPLSPSVELNRTISNYLDRAAHLPSTPTTLAAASDIEKIAEDPRVREFTIEERTPTIEWLKAGSELMRLQKMCQSLLRSDPSVIVNIEEKGKDKNEVMKTVTESFKQRVDELELERLQNKPVWARTEEDLAILKEAEAIDPKDKKESPLKFKVFGPGEKEPDNFL